MEAKIVKIYYHVNYYKFLVQVSGFKSPETILNIPETILNIKEDFKNV